MSDFEIGLDRVSRRSIVTVLWRNQFSFLLQRLDDLGNLGFFDTCDICHLSGLEGFCGFCERIIDDFLILGHSAFHQQLLLYVAF